MKEFFHERNWAFEKSYPEQILGFLGNLAKKSSILSFSGFQINPEVIRAGPRRSI